MKFSSAIAVSASLATLGQALHLQKRTDGPARVVAMDIERRVIDSPVEHDRRRLHRRDGSTVLESLVNNETLYFANCTLGTPPQTLRLHIDTGSSDLWSNVANSNFCQDPQNLCSQSGYYDANSSSTYAYVNSLFNISYEDGTGSSGDYATDDFNIAGATVKNVEFGIGYISSSSQGLLGIGYSDNEAITQIEGQQPYANVPVAMAQQGVINSVAYSLWLNDLQANTGSILFGGIDTDKFTGALETFPIIQEEGTYVEFIIGLTGVGIGSPNSLAHSQSVPVLLDSGSSLMYLPNAIVQNIYNEFDAQYDQGSGVASVACSLANNNTNVQLSFGDLTIEIPMNELVIPFGESRRGTEECIIGISPAGDTTCILGDTFLRSAYVVYDLSSNQISMAQTRFNVSSSNILEITNGTNGVPSATGATGVVSTAGGSDGGSPSITSPPSKAIAPLPKITAMASMAGYAAAGAGLLMAL